ncbi:Xylulokinase [Pseudomonas syringae pv. tagetis]|uniref:Xylulokinase n=1 Tax=Pseudomonas syringae pv. tagetis TaxID=129140 RepID=A0A0Q0E7K9_9PSED|nr:Xylulokinase [Pseudomonas syringae pv. tagetis]RMW17780.1 Xylulokinase [Pseudomonas syringae pv. tagetis]
MLMLPFLNGERVPALPDATGSLVGLDSINLTQANLSRAVVEGTTFGLRYGLDLLRDSGIKSENIRLIGGGSKSAVWRQIVADIMDTPVICTDHAEAAALGAAIQAAWCWSHANGKVQDLQALCERCVSLDQRSETHPVAQNVIAYEQVYQRYQAQLRKI